MATCTKQRSIPASFLYHYISPGRIPPKPATSWVFTSSLNVLDQRLVERVAADLLTSPGLIEKDGHVTRALGAGKRSKARFISRLDDYHASADLRICGSALH
jgi:hypothetical protein